MNDEKHCAICGLLKRNYFSIRTVVRLLSMSETSVRSLVRSGQLSAHKAGCRWCVHHYGVNGLDEFVLKEGSRHVHLAYDEPIGSPPVAPLVITLQRVDGQVELTWPSVSSTKPTLARAILQSPTSADLTEVVSKAAEDILTLMHSADAYVRPCNDGEPAVSSCSKNSQASAERN